MNVHAFKILSLNVTRPNARVRIEGNCSYVVQFIAVRTSELNYAYMKNEPVMGDVYLFNGAPCLSRRIRLRVCVALAQSYYHRAVTDKGANAIAV